jgi:hypothetical protein
MALVHNRKTAKIGGEIKQKKTGFEQLTPWK